MLLRRDCDLCLPVPIMPRCPAPMTYINPTSITHTPSNYTFIPRHFYRGVCFCFSLRLVLPVPVLHCHFLYPLIYRCCCSFSLAFPAFITFCSDLGESLLCCFHNLIAFFKFRFMTHTLALPQFPLTCFAVYMYSTLYFFSSSFRFLLQRAF